MREAIQKLSSRAEFFLIIALCFGYFAFSSAAMLAHGQHDFQMTTARVIRGILIEIGLLSVAAAVLHVRGWRFRTLGLRFSWIGLLAGIPLFIAYIALSWIAYWFVVSLYPEAQNLQGARIVPAAPFALFAIFVLVNSVFEETAVTGYIVTKLSKQGPALSITASALIRFVYHLYQGPISSIVILPLGLIFAAVYWRWRNLWPLMTAHTIVNLVTFAATAHRSG